jgi:hypothetical protein
MNPGTYGTDTLIKAARAAAEAFLTALDEAEGIVPIKAPAGEPNAAELVEYDPLRDAPPFVPNPQKNAPLAQQQMAWITYLGAIGRLNAEDGRGAVSKEISEFAKKAGYSGGAAVNGWNSREGSPRAIEIVDGARFLNSAALGWITKDAAKLGIKLVGEFATVPQAD